ncbi:hypoxanthine phosphoribosyltransferase [Mucilaginibacter sp.]|uniref:hypoxanthine phosphoribosyltransferase n=1 Tax=Mucilaginibacter sp. TaxID=1882438 RepID=UPI0026292B0E|nr:hypoxanthine phosphoribosyltransferase [Mucilaginibacter sp.]MDB5029470.1 hypoxanthine phosphoribosyltransferase [Mucilaginibacter sp.]
MNIKIADLEFEPLISGEAIQARTKEIAAQLNEEYADKAPIFVGVLNGCFMFMADLVKRINVPCEVAFTKLSSYHGGVTTTRRISDDFDLLVDIANRHVILVEDIVDTGHTLDYLVAKLSHRKPASITVCALLLKPDAIEYSIKELKHIAFRIPNEFVVGYGLDYMELGRNLDGIYKRVV